ncbi:MAG TPA: matrixin family metalloprotease [Phycisphaerae bacterium]|nr:matrixin family metalloprotease [Phycisphaerae bacterium]HNU46835.1 matrixin family metalloprotease [Phycisphaerae bacterium]
MNALTQTWGGHRHCWFAALAALAASVCFTGCVGNGPNGNDNTDPTGTLVDGNKDTSLTSPLGKTFGEPNDTFAQAMVAVFDRTGLAELQGNVPAAGDIDVFRLGELDAGDRIIIDAAAPGSQLDVSVVLFDGDQRLVYENDDRNDSSSRYLDPYISFVVRRVGDEYYLAVSHSTFAERGGYTGNYTIDVRVSSGHVVPAPVPQILVLDFDGAFVNSPLLGMVRLDVFDASDIDGSYQGQTEVIKQGIYDTVVQNYERFNVTVLTSDDVLPADPNSYSTIYFGGFSMNAFGLAEAVDLYNADFCDDAIIYTQSFTPNMFTVPPSAQELAIGIGNVAAHEAGHLLGLNHTDDDADLMDAASPADAFLLDQEFMEAPLHGDIMPIGFQDGVLLLNETVGPAAAADP